jgi:dihydrofolate reductase
MHGGGADGTTGIDDDYARRRMENMGAWIMGRNMFGPIRGPWPDDEWRGWWGSKTTAYNTNPAVPSPRGAEQESVADCYDLAALFA